MNITLLPFDTLAIIAWEARANLNAFVTSCKKFAECIAYIPKWQLLHYRSLKKLPRITYIETPSRVFKLIQKRKLIQLQYSLDDDFKRNEPFYTSNKYLENCLVRILYSKRERRAVIYFNVIDDFIDTINYLLLSHGVVIVRREGDIRWGEYDKPLRELVAREISYPHLMTSYKDAMEVLRFIKW